MSAADVFGGMRSGMRVQGAQAKSVWDRLMQVQGTFATFLLGAAACAHSAHAQQAPRWTMSDLDRIGRAFAAEKCPRPSKITTKKILSRYEPEVFDEIKSVSCVGLHVEIYRADASGAPRELPMSVLVDRTQPGIPAALSIGTSAASVRAALGPPALMHEGSLVYFLSAERPGQDTIVFRIAGGKVRELLWGWDVD